METFQIIQPSHLLVPYVKQYCFLQADNAGYGSQRVLPSGAVALTFNRGGKITMSGNDVTFPQAYLYGPTLRHADIIYKDKLDLIIILFKPIGARLFLEHPIYEFNHKIMDLNESTPCFYSLAQYWDDTYSNVQCASIIDEFLIRKLQKSATQKYNRFEVVYDLVENGNYDISKLAESACLGYKQFKRLFFEYTGLNPKDYLRINRCSHLLSKLQSVKMSNLDDIAFDCGYYDKSHLIKEIKAFTGYTPAQYVENCDSFENYKRLFQTMFVENNKSD